MNNSDKIKDIIDDRRQNRYSFTTQKDIITFFSTILPKPIIKETIRTMKKKIKSREDVSKKEIKLQFLKKCEWELVRITKQLLLNSEE